MMPDSFTISKFDKLLKDFKVKNEIELEKKLIEESLTLTCQFCHKEKSIYEFHFYDGDPVCDGCWRNECD